MRRGPLIVMAGIVAVLAVAPARGDRDIAVARLPAAAHHAVDAYLALLRTCDGDACTSRFARLAGGRLVDDDGALRSSVRYSLARDGRHVARYAWPAEVLRVRESAAGAIGSGARALQGRVYTIWIARARGERGGPAAIGVAVPERGAPARIVEIGNL